MTNQNKIIIGISAIVVLIILVSGSGESDSVQEIKKLNTTKEIELVKEIKEVKLLSETKVSESKNENKEGESINIIKTIIPIQPIKTTPSCHPSYSGCLNPNASDYDCAGGSGNGPYYTGTVRVIGPDVFGLDRDKDGWGCE